jgi:hypothetical protein
LGMKIPKSTPMSGFVTIGACALFPSWRLSLGALYFPFVFVLYHRVSGCWWSYCRRA